MELDVHERGIKRAGLRDVGGGHAGRCRHLGDLVPLDGGSGGLAGDALLLAERGEHLRLRIVDGEPLVGGIRLVGQGLGVAHGIVAEDLGDGLADALDLEAALLLKKLDGLAHRVLALGLIGLLDGLLAHLDGLDVEGHGLDLDAVELVSAHDVVSG